MSEWCTTPVCSVSPYTHLRRFGCPSVPERPRNRLMAELEGLVDKYRREGPSTLLAELEDFVRKNKNT